MSGHAVILGGGKSQRPYIEEFKNRGWSATVIDRDTNSVSRDISDVFIENSIYELDSIIQQLTPHHKKTPISLIYSNSSAEPVAKNVAALNEHFATAQPCFNTESVMLCYSKANMRKSMIAMGVNMAKEFTAAQTKPSDFPLIAKPVSGGIGGFGVCKINTQEALTKLQGKHADTQWLFEAYIEGAEYSVDGIVVGHELEIISICKKSSGEQRSDFIPDRFQLIPLGGDLQKPDPQKKDVKKKGAQKIDFDALYKQSVLAAKALKINNSQISLDVKIAPNGQIFIIECGLFWDSKIDRLWSFSGFNPYSYLIDRLYFNKQQDPEEKPKPCSMEFIYAKSEGPFSRNDVIKSHPNMHIEFERKDGDIVKAPQSVSDLLACNFYWNEEQP